MNNRQEVTKLAREVERRTNGLYGLTTYSPGDGVTRYRLGTTGASDGRHDYFGDRAEVTTLGAASAVDMCRAFLAGLDAR